MYFSGRNSLLRWHVNLCNGCGMFVHFLFRRPIPCWCSGVGRCLYGCSLESTRILALLTQVPDRRSLHTSLLDFYVKIWSVFQALHHSTSNMDKQEIIEYFKTQMADGSGTASAVAAIRSLLEFLKRDEGETIKGLRENLTEAIQTLMGVESSVAVSSGGELFLRFISLTSLEDSDYSKCKRIMIDRGEVFLSKISPSRKKIAQLCHIFIKDGATILTHAFSRVVLSVLQEAAAAKKRFSVYVTESQPDCAGKNMADALQKLNVPVTVILDAAVGCIMEKVDLVIVGAEGVVENGGIINKIGTNQMAVCAKAQNKPFYVVAESFKFVRLFPLNQRDVPDKFKYKADTLKSGKNLAEEHPWIDYTAPSLITLLFTDLGVLTPSAVSDELIKLYL